MEISVATQDSVSIISVVGEIDGSTAPRLQQAVAQLAEPGSRLIIDMSGVSFMSSAGLRALLVVYRLVHKQGGRIVLAGLPQELEQMMSIVGFLDFFDHEPDVPSGLAVLT